MRLFLFFLSIACFATELTASPAETVDFPAIERRAEALARAPFVPLEKTVPPEAGEMNYVSYRGIQFNKEKAIWAGTWLPVRLEMFYRAFIFPEQVKINVIDLKGNIREILLDPGMYSLVPGTPGTLPSVPPSYGFSGLKVFYNFPKPRGLEEMIIFQGASYFRIPAKGQYFGLSARGIAVNTAAKNASEEFPAFTELWVREPKPGQEEITVYALLDGPTVTGAYEFTAHPEKATTIVRVKASLFFRATPSRVGYAPLTSMFWYGENNYRRFADYRPEVHDSDGLLILAADGNRIWRPLQTVAENLVDEYPFRSAPRGFGLLQRDRNFSNHVDIEANYHRRPSLWVEPSSGFDDGSIVLWQIATEDEYHDNIVAYWMPRVIPKAGEKRSLSYTLVTTTDEPPDLPSSGQVLATYIMSSYGRTDRYLIMNDFAWGGERPPSLFPAEKLPGIEIKSEGAEILSKYIVPNLEGRSWRLHTVVQFPSPQMKSRLQYQLTGPQGWRSEQWNYTFVPQE